VPCLHFHTAGIPDPEPLPRDLCNPLPLFAASWISPSRFPSGCRRHAGEGGCLCQSYRPPYVNYKMQACGSGRSHQSGQEPAGYHNTDASGILVVTRDDAGYGTMDSVALSRQPQCNVSPIWAYAAATSIPRR
jgi:hypothetical protein